MSGVNFDKQSAIRISTQVQRGERTSVSMPNTTARPRKGALVTPTASHPWKMSLFKKDGDDTQYCKVLGGVIDTNITNAVPEGLVNLFSYGNGDTAYIYARIANDWQVGGSLNSYPTLTVLTGENDTNFAGNNVRFPASDFGYYFFAIGTIDVETIPDTTPTQYKYTINQIATDNTSIDYLELKPLGGYSFYAEKGSDTATDTQSVNIVTEGYVKLPIGSSVPLSETQETESLLTKKYANIIINSTRNETGFHENFTAEMEFSTNTGTDTDTKNYYTAASFLNNSPTSYNAYIISDGRIW